MDGRVYGYSFFKNLGVIEEGHFVLRSGKHSNQYIRKDKIFEIPFEYWEIIENLARLAEPYGPEVIAGPQSGGAKLARSLAKEMNIDYVELEKGKEDYEFWVLAGDSETIFNKVVVVVDDVLTTGGSVRGSIKAVQKAGGKAAAALGIIDRSIEQVDLCVDVYFQALCYIGLSQWDEDDCPYCSMFGTPPSS